MNYYSVVLLSSLIRYIHACHKRLFLTREHVLATGWTEKQLTDIEAIHGDVSQYFLKHFCHVCLTLPAKDNFYLSLWMRGTRGFSPDKNPELAPPFLQRKNFLRLKVCYKLSNIKKFVTITHYVSAISSSSFSIYWGCSRLLVQRDTPIFNKVSGNNYLH